MVSFAVVIGIVVTIIAMFFALLVFIGVRSDDSAVIYLKKFLRGDEKHSGGSASSIDSSTAEYDMLDDASNIGGGSDSMGDPDVDSITTDTTIGNNVSTSSTDTGSDSVDAGPDNSSSGVNETSSIPSSDSTSGDDYMSFDNDFSTPSDRTGSSTSNSQKDTESIDDDIAENVRNDIQNSITTPSPPEDED